MKPYYSEDGITIYHGDCLEVAEWLEADVLVTDPPYGIGWTNNGISRTSGNSRKHGRFPGDARPHNPGIVNDQSTDARDVALDMWAPKPAIVFGSLLAPMPLATRHVAIYVKPLDAGAMSALAGLRRDCEAIYLLGQSETWVGGGLGPVSSRPLPVQPGTRRAWQLAQGIRTRNQSTLWLT